MEAMVVVSGGTATIRFGVADTPNWVQGHLAPGARGGGEAGGVDIIASLGDVFIIPAGVSHKTFAPYPETMDLIFHQPADLERGRARETLDEKSEERHRDFFAQVPIEGEFMMMGAYPRGGVWDFKVGGEHKEREDDVWGVDVPEQDPVLGLREEGLRGLWRGI
jgi:uncharacterized protein YjlB